MTHPASARRARRSGASARWQREFVNEAFNLMAVFLATISWAYPHSSRKDLKKAHLRRWAAWALAAAYVQYASLGLTLAALHLSLFEQPG